jgi:hypothetical protein
MNLYAKDHLLTAREARRARFRATVLEANATRGLFDRELVNIAKELAEFHQERARGSYHHLREHLVSLGKWRRRSY